MWAITQVALCPLLHCGEVRPEHPIYALPPAATQEACHIAGHDYMAEWLRLKGESWPFSIICEESA